MTFYDLATYHLTVFDLHTFTGDDTEFFLIGGDDEEESVVEIFLPDSTLIEQLESYIDELISLSMRDKYG